MTNRTRVNVSATVPEYSDEKRLSVYKMLTKACTHLFSKGKLQVDKFNALTPIFADLTKNDPLFMAHFTAWAAKQDSKDMKVVSLFFNALNDADGTPFFKGSELNKPNLRSVSHYLLQNLDPHLALRVLELCHMKFSVNGLLNEAKHFPTSFKNAYKKYLRYRENNPEMLWGIRKGGLSKKMAQIYRLTNTGPSDDAASILNWKQKNRPDLKMENLPTLEGKTATEIAEEITKSKMSPMVAISLIPSEKITAKVAESLLGNCSGNQSIILYNWFAKNGFLDVKSINDLFIKKVSKATTAIDRIDTLTKDADVKDKEVMSQIRSEKRKEKANTDGLGKIYLHIDASGSMEPAIQFAKDKASIIAECVTNPAENFQWGLFGSRAQKLVVPKNFKKEDFYASLYGVKANMGSTDCLALYADARSFGANVDVYITDEEHNVGALEDRINRFHRENPNISKPSAVVIVRFGRHDMLERAFKACSIPVTVLTPDSLSESALVAQSVRTAMVGELSIINEIMDTVLPNAPRWYATA